MSALHECPACWSLAFAVRHRQRDNMAVGYCLRCGYRDTAKREPYHTIPAPPDPESETPMSMEPYMDQDESNEHARPDRAEIPPEPMSDGERLAYMGTDAARWTDQFLGTLRWSPDGTAALDWGHVLGWFANAIEAGRAAAAPPDPKETQ